MKDSKKQRKLRGIFPGVSSPIPEDILQITVLNLPLSSKNVMKMKVEMMRVHSMPSYNTRMTLQESKISKLLAKPMEQRTHTTKTKK